MSVNHTHAHSTVPHLQRMCYCRLFFLLSLDPEVDWRDRPSLRLNPSLFLSGFGSPLSWPEYNIWTTKEKAVNTSWLHCCCCHVLFWGDLSIMVLFHVSCRWSSARHRCVTLTTIITWSGISLTKCRLLNLHCESPRASFSGSISSWLYANYTLVVMRRMQEWAFDVHCQYESKNLFLFSVDGECSTCIDSPSFLYTYYTCYGMFAMERRENRFFEDVLYLCHPLRWPKNQHW